MELTSVSHHVAVCINNTEKICQRGLNTYLVLGGSDHTSLNHRSYHIEYSAINQTYEHSHIIKCKSFTCIKYVKIKAVSGYHESP